MYLICVYTYIDSGYTGIVYYITRRYDNDRNGPRGVQYRSNVVVILYRYTLTYDIVSVKNLNACCDLVLTKKRLVYSE